MGPLVVVVAVESLDLGLEPVQCLRGPVAGEPLLLGLVESLDLAAGLRVVGPGVVEDDAEPAQEAFEGDLAVTTGFAGEDGTVEFLRDVKPLRVA